MTKRGGGDRKRGRETETDREKGREGGRQRHRGKKGGRETGTERDREKER